jgi:hypothetical protein
MKTLLCTLMFASLATAAARADSVSITFSQPNQTTTPGQTLEFFGTITNLTGNTIFLNADDLDLAGQSFTTNDQFFNTVPISLAPSGQSGSSSGLIELFDVTVSNPLLNPFGKYSGVYTLFGGNDGGAGTAQDNLGSANFSVSPVPEPSTIYLLLGAIPATWLPLSRKLRARAT